MLHNRAARKRLVLDLFSATAARMSAFNAAGVDRLGLADVNGASRVPFEAGVEEARRILKRRPWRRPS